MKTNTNKIGVYQTPMLDILEMDGLRALCASSEDTVTVEQVIVDTEIFF